MIRIFMLGGLRLESDGAALTGAAARRRPLALLAILASAGGNGISRDKVAALLWPESDTERSRNTLKQTVYALRRELGDVIVGGIELRLNPFTCTADVWDFEQAIQNGDPAQAGALYQGPFLDGFHLDVAEFERWMDEQAVRYALAAGSALLSWAERARTAGNLQAAVEAYRRRAAFDRYNARASSDLVLALAESGDKLGALRHIRQFEALVREDLGHAPDASWRALADRVAQSSPVAFADERAPRTADDPRPTNNVSVAIHDATQSLAALPGRSGSRWWMLSGATALIILLAITSRFFSPPLKASAPEGIVVLIAPFRVDDASAEFAYLRNGFVDLLSTSLSTSGTVRTTDGRAVLKTFSEDREAISNEVQRTARKVGAKFSIHGAIVGDQKKLTITATLRDTTGRITAPFTLSAPYDSLPALVDALGAAVLASITDEPVRGRPYLARHSIASVRAFVDGQAAYRKGHWAIAEAAYRNALNEDSTFALAALGLMASANWLGDRESRARGQALAWNARRDLPAPDWAYLEAFVGPGYPHRPTKREHLDAWERASRLAGDRPEVWFALGDEYFHNGALLGFENALEKAASAFERALRIDSAYTAPLVHLIQVRATQGDTARLRTIRYRITAQPFVNDYHFVQWRVAVATASQRAVDSLRRQLQHADDESLTSIALTGMYEGINLPDAEAALRLSWRRAAGEEEKRQALLGFHALAVLRGRKSEATGYLASLTELDPRSSESHRITLTDAIYSDGDRSYAKNAAQFLRYALQTGRSATPAEDRCALEQWNILNGDTSTVRRSIELLSRRRTGSNEDSFSEAKVCALLLTAMQAMAGPHDGSTRALASLDSALSIVPIIKTMTQYAPLALARLYAARGDSAKALVAVRRRGWWGRWPRYYAAQLELEVELARAMREEGRIGAALEYVTRMRTPTH